MGSRVAPSPPAGQEEWMPDQIMDYYLASTPYTQQTLLSMRVALTSVWLRQLHAHGPVETREKLKNFWVNIGLVSALLLGVTFQSAIEPITSDDPEHAHAQTIVAVFMGMSLVFSLTVIVVSVIYIIEIDNAVTERDLVDFITANASVVDILLGVFCCSVVFIMVAALAAMYMTYGRVEFMVVVCVSGAIALVTGVLAAIVAGHGRFRLWIRFESPLGKQLLERLRGHEQKELVKLKQELEFQTRQLSELKELLELKELKDKVEQHDATKVV